MAVPMVVSMVHWLVVQTADPMVVQKVVQKAGLSVGQMVDQIADQTAL